jgi:hypothetical protein
VTVFASVVPFVGRDAVWVPGTVYLLGTGAWPKAIVLAVWGAAVVSSVDNILRPRLVAGRVRLSGLAMFVAILGGLQAFGALGIILGPVLFAMAAAMVCTHEGALQSLGTFTVWEGLKLHTRSDRTRYDGPLLIWTPTSRPVARPEASTYSMCPSIPTSPVSVSRHMEPIRATAVATAATPRRSCA